MTLLSEIFEAQVSQIDAADLDPTFLTEPADSGAAAAQGLTYLDPTAGWPAATENQTITAFADVTIGASDYVGGQSIRAVRDTVGGIGADWAGWVGGNADESLEVVDVTGGVARVLPAATGSGATRTFVVYGNGGLTVTPQPGEILGGTADGTSSFWDSNGQTVTATDVALGEWVIGPNLVTLASTARVGEVGHSHPDPANGKYEVDGSTHVDVALAAHLILKPIDGFVVTGSSIQMPDWRGRYLGAAGGLGLNSTSGQLYDDATAANGLRINKRYLQWDWSGGVTSAVSQANVTGGAFVNDGQSLSSTDTHTRPPTVSMPICIIGTEPQMIQAGTLQAEPLRDVLFEGVVSHGGTFTIPDQAALLAAGYEFVEFDLEAERAGQQYPMQYRRTVSDGFASLTLWEADATSSLIATADVAGTTFTVTYSGSFNIAGNQRVYGVRKQYNAVRAEDRLVVNHNGVLPGDSFTIPTTVGGRTLVNVTGQALTSAGGTNYLNPRVDGTNTYYASYDLTTGLITYDGRTGAFFAAGDKRYNFDAHYE